MSATANLLRRVLAANSTATSFTEKEVKSSAPSGEAVISFLDNANAHVLSGKAPSYVQVVPFGTDADTETFELRLWGWSKTNDSTPLYIPQLLAELAVVLGPTTGCDGAVIGTNHLMADTITVNEGSSDGPFTSVISTGDDTAASALVHLRGVHYLEFDFDLTGAAACNAFYRFVD